MEVQHMSTNFKQLPLLALRGIVIFPMTEIHLNIGRKESVLALEQAMMGNQQLFVTAQKRTSVTTPKKEDVYPHGTIVHIKHVEKLAMVRLGYSLKEKYGRKSHGL